MEVFGKEWLLKDWIETHVRPRKTVNKRYSSYGLKHIAENYICGYISNEEFIAAMETAGYEKWQSAMDRVHNSPNFYFRAKYIHV